MKAGSGGVTSDLASMLQTQPVRQQELFSHALRIIHSMESSPTCNRLAALTLINSCQSLEQASDDAKKNSELVLDEVKSEYAARLAVCELIGAKASTPKECSVLVPSSHACGKFKVKFFFRRKEEHSDSELCYPEASHSQFEQCLRALESRPQWWTSYSNARQNAVVMCQASRDAIERDEKLALYKSLADATSGISSALAKSIEEAQQRLHEHMQFIEAIRQSQAKVMTDMKQGHEEAKSSLSQVVMDVRAAVQSTLSMMSQAFRTAESQVDQLNESLEKSRSSAAETREELLNMVQSIFDHASKQTALQTNQLHTNHEYAVEVQHAIDVMRSVHLEALSEAIGSLREDVHSSATVMTDMYERQHGLNMRLTDLSDAFGDLETSASRLQQTIEESTEKVQMLNIFCGLPFSSSILLGGSLILLGLWFASKRLAGFVMALLGLSWIYHSSGLSDYVRGSYGSFTLLSIDTIQAHPQVASYGMIFLAVIFSLVMCGLLIGVIAHFYTDTQVYAYRDDQGKEGMLPRIETPEPPATPTRRPRHHLNPFSAVRSCFR